MRVERSIADYYSARAPEYDSVYQKPERQQDIRTLAECVRSRFIGHRVLDVAAGTGYWTQHFAPSARSVTALDIAPQTLAIAAQRLPGNVSFVRGDAYQLPFKVRTFDASFVGFWLSHVPRHRWTEFFARLHAVLARPAKVLIIDNLYVEGSSHPIAQVDSEGNTFQLRRLRNGSTHRVLKNFPTEVELVELVGSTGEEIEYSSFKYYWSLEYRIIESVRGSSWEHS